MARAVGAVAGRARAARGRDHEPRLVLAGRPGRASRSTCAARCLARGRLLPLRARGGPRIACRTTSPEDFEPSPAAHCDGSERSGAFAGVLGTRRRRRAEARASRRAQATSPAASPARGGQSSNGRPNSEPYGFTVKACASTSGETSRGEDRRNLFLHRDSDLLPGFPRAACRATARPRRVLADLDGDNRNELIVATSDGSVHAYRPRRRGGARLAGARRAASRCTRRRRAFESGAVSPDASRGAFLASPAVGRPRPRRRARGRGRRLRGTRSTRGTRDGTRRWTRRTHRDCSGRPLRAFDEASQGRAQPHPAWLHRLAGARRPRRRRAARDRGRGDGPPRVRLERRRRRRVPGFPALVVDRSKVAVDRPGRRTRSPSTPQAGDSLKQGAIVDTPAVGDLDRRRPRPRSWSARTRSTRSDAPGRAGPTRTT